VVARHRTVPPGVGVYYSAQTRRRVTIAWASQPAGAPGASSPASSLAPSAPVRVAQAVRDFSPRGSRPDSTRRL
jgi:hypothetical protein